MSLKLEQAEYSYGDGFRLEPVSFEPAEGTFTVLLGPNGSGKTTLFSLMNGLLKPRKGRVLLGNQEVHRIPARSRARMLGLVPQISDRSFDYTVQEMVEMGRYPYQDLFARTSREDRRIIRDCMIRLELDGMADRSILSLSGGEYQRVLLCRVLVQDPGILLLDEPANHLDLKHQNLLLSLLRDETRRGKTVVAVLHDINQALLYADQGLLLHRGRLVVSGRPGDILDRDILKSVYDVELDEYWNSEKERKLFGPSRRDLKPE